MQASPPHHAPARRALCLAGLYGPLLTLLTGCAQTPHRSATATRSGPWSGRIHLRVDDAPAPRSFTAHFELQGSADTGTLELSTPLGTLLARLQWSADQATMETPQAQHHAPTLQALLREVTGETLPADALFDWLSGVPTTSGGWHVDLQQLAQGRLSATRSQPLPPATLRILLNP